MQSSSNARRLLRALLRRPTLLASQPSLASAAAAAAAAVERLPAKWAPSRGFFQSPHPSGLEHCNLLPAEAKIQQWRCYPSCSPMLSACFSSDVNSQTKSPTVVVEELYGKMSKSVEARTMPPNAWLWSMISNCSNLEDIKLLFEILQKLRIFRLSNLRIHANFNCHLCMRVTEACARVGALDYGLKALWKHNVYGLTPTIGSVHYLLRHAEEHSDTKLMRNIMEVLQKNSLPLQPGTADIVFRICYGTDRWDLLSKYATRFVKAGVKLHGAAFDIWMDFAAKIGDSQSIWKADSLRAKFVKQHTLATGFACAKGFLLESKPDNAAMTIQLLYQNLPDTKKTHVKDELQKLISEWPLEVIKRQRKEARKEAEELLRTNIRLMITSILNMGLDLAVNAEEIGLMT